MFSLPQNGSEWNSESLFLFLFHGTEFWVVFSSAERFGRESRELASISGPRTGIPSCFLFHWRVRKGIPRFYFYFWSTIGIPSCFLFRGRVRNLKFSVPRNSRNSGIPSEITIYFIYSVFREIIFLSEIPHPRYTWWWESHPHNWRRVWGWGIPGDEGVTHTAEGRG